MIALALLFVATGLAGCGAAGPYLTTTLALDGRTPAAALGSRPDDLEIARTAAGLIHGRLGLPFPAETTVHLYVNQATFAEGLAREGRLAGNDSWDRALFAGGVASPRGIFLRADLLASMRLADRVGLIAHELTHVSQMEMRRGGRGAPAVWLREGHADWVKFRVIELLGFRSYAESRSEVRRSILRSQTPVRHFPELQELSGGDQWTHARVRLGSAATYGQAFLAVDWLVERYGVEKVHEFQRRFALELAPASHWAAVFPVPFPDVARDFRRDLERLTE